MTQHIAVVGGGLAGLAAAWLLGRVHAVTLFERAAQPGFTAAAVSLSGGARVDVPLRVFYPGYYPALTRLYAALGVASQPVSYAGSFAGSDGRLYFRYRNLLRGDAAYGWVAPADLLHGRRAWRILHGLLRFRRLALPALHGGTLRGRSIGDFLAEHRFAADFVHGFLLPTVATVCTCSHAQALRFPAAVVVGYLAGGVARQAVRRALHGADDVQRRLLQGIGTLHCGARIRAVQPGAQGVALQLADGSTQHFDQVVLATQANQALDLLGDDSAAEAAMLRGFEYTPVQVLTHRDSALLPPRRADWSPVNLWVAPEFDAPQSTIWINAVQPALRGQADVFQTVNPLRAPRDELVLGRAQFERPLVSARSEAALAALAQLQAQPGRRLWFCGSWAQPGIPLLESAVASAFAVAQRLGAPLPGPLNS